MFKENTKVKTLVAKEDYAKRTIGVIISIYTSGSACEVELWNENNYPIDVVTYLFSELTLCE